jgi:hypothetical protein
LLALLVSLGAALFWADRCPAGAENSPAPVAKVVGFSAKAADPALNPHRWLYSPEVVADAKDGAVRLAHSVLIADETGATDFRQTEELSDKTWAKKVFHLESAEVTQAELFLFGAAGQIRVNGQALSKTEPLISTGFTRALVPPGLLKAGDNEVIFLGPGSLLIEPGRKPGRSSKSTDGGRTWSADTLGAKGNQEGEYLVRLRLGRYAPRGSTVSGVFDLWKGPAGEPAQSGQCLAVKGMAALNQGQPAGTRLVPWLRTGTTPSPDPKTWTDWLALDRDFRPAKEAARHRWAQLKIDLATHRPQATPHLPASFELRCDFLADPLPGKDRIVVQEPAGVPPIEMTSVPFVYQEPSPRLKLLRERYQLDQVIAPGKTEMEQLMLLRYWVRNQWHTAWGSDPAAWMPPWDALMILESKDLPDCLTMCTHYATVFTQCCLALGWTARHCILDHHCVAEVWVNQHAKWVMMDAGNSAERADVGLHFERAGVPQSAREMHQAQRTGQTKDVVVCFTPAKLLGQIAARCRPEPAAKAKRAPRPDTVALAELPQFPVCQLDTYRRYAFPGRNDFLTSLFPGELYQGWSHYFYDGYWWVGDSPDEPAISPEYSRQLSPARPQDIDWSVNWTRIHLARTANPGELQVDLENLTPNLARLEQVAGNGAKAPAEAWKATPAHFVWKLAPGVNVLRARSVNQFDRPGIEASVRVEWKPAKP